MKKLYYRVHQQFYRFASYFVKWHTPIIIEGQDVYSDLVMHLSDYKKALVVTDATLMKLGLLKELLKRIEAADLSYMIYDKTQVNPTIENIEEAFELYRVNGCDVIIAFGGGSPMDCAKVVAARAVKPSKTVKEMKGLRKIKCEIAPIFAIPTTAGTGSETTIAAVITDQLTHEKYPISDMCLVPKYAVFIPELTLGLPPFITATTGMDALTHAIESYIGQCNTRQTREDALMAAKLIKENLWEAYRQGDNIKVRANMQRASFYAGRAFTRAYVGNVHAIAHALGGMYNLPHGYTNALALPVVLRAYGPIVHKHLAEIADVMTLGELGDTPASKSQALICWIEDMNAKMGIGSNIKEIEIKDMGTIAKRAADEANPFYPVPEIWSVTKFESVLYQLKK